MQIRLDYNNRVEVYSKNMNNSGNQKGNLKKGGMNKSFDLNAIKKRFNIDENNYKLKQVKNTIDSILNPRNLQGNQHSSGDNEIEDMILNDI